MRGPLFRVGRSGRIRDKRDDSGWYWLSTTGGHVAYESRLELARLLLADADPDVVAMAAQPFVLIEGTEARPGPSP